MEVFSYRKLRVYQNSKTLVISVYNILKQFPLEEKFALCDQLRRAVISIPSNIAEGMSRSSSKEQLYFLEIAYGSLNEVMSQLEMAQELNYITQNQLEQMENQYKNIAQMLSGLRKSKLKA